MACGLPDCVPDVPRAQRAPAPDFDDPAIRDLPTPVELVAEAPRRTSPIRLSDVRFSEIEGGDVSSHVLPVRRDDLLGYGWGAALLDYDGDLDVDLFLGGRPSSTGEPCIYRNDSTPGEVHFTRDEATCLTGVGDAFAGGAVDLDGDGLDELIVGGRDLALWIRFGDPIEIVDLLALEGEDDRRPCNLSAALPFDLDQDGYIDLILACQPESGGSRPRAAADLAIRNLPGGGMRYFGPEITDGWLRDSNTLALGALDLDLDGLLDIVLVVDTFSRPSNRNLMMDPGGPLLRCGPLSGCVFDAQTMLAGVEAWGSFMGLGNLRVAGGFDALYLTDWGPNRLIEWAWADSLDHATPLDASLRERNGEDIFSWGVVVDDFDLNGTDDLFVSQGAIHVFGDEVAARHRDMLLLQRYDGRFDGVSGAAGIPPNTAVSGSDRPYFLSRAALKADFDADGRLEILVLAYDGRHRLLSEVREDPPRCSLVPRARYVPAFGTGYAVRSSGSPDFVRRDVQGQFQAGTSPHVLTSAPAGTLRFASGGEREFDCGTGHGPLVVEEPEWISLARVGADLAVELDAPWWPSPLVIEAAVRESDGDVLRVRPAWDPGRERYVVPLGPSAEAVMLRLEQRWVGRWLAIP